MGTGAELQLVTRCAHYMCLCVCVCVFVCVCVCFFFLCVCVCVRACFCVHVWVGICSISLWLTTVQFLRSQSVGTWDHNLSTEYACLTEVHPISQCICPVPYR